MTLLTIIFIYFAIGAVVGIAMWRIWDPEQRQKEPRLVIGHCVSDLVIWPLTMFILFVDLTGRRR